MSDQKLDLESLPEAQRKQLERMTADKFICDLIGIRLTSVGNGSATAELTVTPMHLNGVDICQGGALFSLADYALAAAFNYTDESVVSLDVSISYCKPAKSGTRLVAEAKETVRTRSTTVGEVVVKDQDGRIICLARGRGFVIQTR
ncbi:MAG: PaaI family thioesterase [Thermoguttaceae bacterium]|nr:PaaI family thioesterase [Thermoguttaceae bacterium]